MGSQPDDETRIAAALDLANQGGDPKSLALLQKRKVRRIRLLIVVFVVAVIVGLAIGFYGGNHGRHTSGRSTVAGWRSALGLVLIVAGVAAEIVC